MSLHTVIDQIRASNPAHLQDVADSWLTCTLAERDPAAAATALAALGENSFGNGIIKFSPHFVEGLIARMTKDDARALSTFTAARGEQEKAVRDQPDYGPALCVLGLIDAGLGRKEEALSEGRRAVELLPVAKDALNGTRMIECLSMIAAGWRQGCLLRTARCCPALLELPQSWKTKTPPVLGSVAWRSPV